MYTTFQNIPDNGYELAEELEQSEKAKERLLWIKRGFAWRNNMTDKQAEVAYYKLFSEKTDKNIGKILNIKRPAVTRRWKRAVKQGVNVTF